MSRLEEWSYDASKVEIDYQNAQGDSAKLEEICQGFVEDGVDMIVAVSHPRGPGRGKGRPGHGGQGALRRGERPPEGPGHRQSG